MPDLPVTGLRVLREVAERGSLTAAAAALGYTQSGVSRQLAALEALAGRALVARGRRGARLTPAGERLLTRAVRVLDELDAAAAELADPSAAAGPVRLGAYPVACATLIPQALAALPSTLRVSVREATTPALVRALRAGSLDLAVLAQSPPFRPPDASSPPLELTPLGEGELRVAVGPGHPLAGRRAVEVGELEGQVWVASRTDAGETLLGVWPGVAERAEIRYVVRDWLAKLQLVAAGLAITTVPPTMAAALPPGVKLLAVRGEPHEARRIVAARLPGEPAPGVTAVLDALRGTG